MRKFPDLAALVLVLGLAVPGGAETLPSECQALEAALESITRYSLTASPAATDNGWCVLDGAVLLSERADSPNISVKRLRLRGTEAEGKMQSLAVDVGVLRVTPKLGDTTMDGWLRDLVKLQTADVRLSVAQSGDKLELREGLIVLSGGSELAFDADIAGAGFSVGSLLSATVTMLKLNWKNDGKLLRPLMETTGERLVDGAQGSEAISAIRTLLRQHTDNLPKELFEGEAFAEIRQLILALPQGRGRLMLEFRSETGTGGAQIAIAALSDDPTGPDTLQRLFGGAALSLDWQPGIAP
jgi:hypothetical protein